MNIKVYGADWCPDCVNAKNFLNSKGVEFEYIDITDNEQAIALVEQINNGRRVIPTLVVDGKTYTNPGIAGLMNILAQ
jgi:thioredoxin reductase (NADPH)